MRALLARRTLLVAAALAGCMEDLPDLPPLPPGATSSGYYSFRSTVGSLDLYAISAVLDQLEPRFGRVNQGRLRVFRHEMPDGTDSNVVRGHYGAMLTPYGMAPLALSAAPGSWAVAFAGRGGVLAAEALILRGDDQTGKVPFNIITNLKPRQPA